VIPAGSRVQSVPGPGETQQAFETSDDLTARAAWNNLQVRLTRPQQPAEIFAPKTLPIPLYLQGIATGLKPNDPLLIGTGGTPALFRVLKVEPDAAKGRTRVAIEPWRKGDGGEDSGVKVRTTTSLADPKVMAALSRQPARPPRGGPERNARTLLAPGADLSARLLTVARPELRDVLYKAWANVPVVEAPVLQVCALRVRASVFGHNAPLERHVDDGVLTSPQEWALGKEEKDVVWLDAPYPQILPQSWIVLQRPQANGPVRDLVITRVEETAEQSRAAYGVSPKAIRIKLGRDWLKLDREDGDRPDEFDVVRGTAVFAQCEELALAEEPIEEPLCGGEIELAGIYDGLQPGRWLIVSGERADVGEVEKDKVEARIPGVPAAELVLLAGVRQDVSRRDAKGTEPDGTKELPAPWPGERTHTTLPLAMPLAYCYKRDTVTVYGNVAHATHGETRFEVLGSGDGAKALQAFTLKQPPLTWASRARSRCGSATCAGTWRGASRRWGRRTAATSCARTTAGRRPWSSATASAGRGCPPGPRTCAPPIAAASARGATSRPASSASSPPGRWG
jgi:hypothetical protein